MLVKLGVYDQFISANAINDGIFENRQDFFIKLRNIYLLFYVYTKNYIICLVIIICNNGT